MRLPFLILTVALMVASCSSRQVVEVDTSGEMRDNIWLNEDTLQLYDEHDGGSDLKPETLRRDEACTTARLKIEKKLEYLYPRVKDTELKRKSHATIYYSGGGCRIYIRYSARNLKEKLTGS